MNALARSVVLAVCAPFALAQGDLPTLQQIMADPSWFARSPESARWLADGSGVLFEQRREGVLGRDTRDTSVLGLRGVEAGANARLLDADEYATTLTDSGDWSPDRATMVTSAGGDLFLFERSSGTTTQLTRTVVNESGAMFLADGRTIAFRRDGRWVLRSADGTERDAAEIRFAKDPSKEDKKPERGDLEQREHDLFRFLQEREERDDLNKEVDRGRTNADPTGPAGPFYLDPERREAGQWLSPSGEWLLVAQSPRDRGGDKADIMPAYVTESGYVTTSPLRPKVGYESDGAVSFVLLDLSGERVIDLPLDGLPSIADDPLKSIRDAAKSREKGEDAENPSEGSDVADGEEGTKEDTEKEDDKPAKPRPVGQIGVRWSESGRHAAVMLRSHDNKDRWIVTVDTQAEAPVWTTAHHQRDEAWIQWGFNEFGFVPGSETLWFTSEHDGWGHLYTADPAAAGIRQMTSGAWEVRDITPLADGSAFLMRTNRTDHGIYEIERVSLNGTITPVTAMGGTVESFRLSPEQQRLVFTWSDTIDPPELYSVNAAGGEPVRLTRTDTDLYRSFDWVEPEFVRVPSTHANLPIHTRVYRPDPERFPGPRPIVIFSHGAGYLQFVHRGWSYYFREHMFHTLLAERGILVLGPDFRHSEGYGREWRTAVYRNLGYPELEDFDDCIAYAAEHLDGDPQRVGIYGGSYGGFMTLMALFLRPDVYDAGAALRSVTDWRHYNHGWTSNCLDTPQTDPEPFDRCSPISHAEHLKGALLMCHGMLDDNVVAQDVIRLSQRLIELEKENWELALYPIEPHGFVEPSAWLDEYRRILRLFEENLLTETRP
jgi:dipeptidyl aminopeptidase/acylaminoacyl peptidase